MSISETNAEGNLRLNKNEFRCFLSANSRSSPFLFVILIQFNKNEQKLNTHKPISLGCTNHSGRYRRKYEQS